jgi:hypothetical protein
MRGGKRVAGKALRAWLQRAEQAIEAHERAAAPLTSYARAVAIAEAALARYRLRDALLLEVSRDSLEVDSDDLGRALAPILASARAPGEEALRALVELGAVDDERVRDLLAQRHADESSWAGNVWAIDASRRMQAPLPPGVTLSDAAALHGALHFPRYLGGPELLAGIRLPPRPAVTPGSPEERLAQALPTWYAGELLPADLLSHPTFVTTLGLRGLARPLRRAVQTTAPTAAGLRAQVRHRFAAMNVLMRPVDVDEAIALAGKWRGLAGDSEDEATFYLAAALALRTGVAPEARGVTNVAPLDAFVSARPTGLLTDLALWSAAGLVERSAPIEGRSAHLARAARRYRDAARSMDDERLRRECEGDAARLEREAREARDRGE